MAETSTDETGRVARRYFAAWTSRDRDAVSSCLDPGFRSASGGHVVEGREAFLSAATYPAAEATTTMRAGAYQGEVGFHLYGSTNHGRSVLASERLIVRDGAVVDSIVVTDMASFTAFLHAAGGEA